MVKPPRRSRLSISIQKELIKYFCAGFTAAFRRELSGVNDGLEQNEEAVLRMQKLAKAYSKIAEKVANQNAIAIQKNLSSKLSVDFLFFCFCDCHNK